MKSSRLTALIFGLTLISCPVASAQDVVPQGEEIGEFEAKHEMAKSLSYNDETLSQAAEVYRELLSARKNNSEVEYEYALVLERLGKTREMVARLEGLMGRVEKPELPVKLSEGLLALKRYGDARRVSETYLRSRPNDTRARLVLARAFAWSGDWKGALPHYEKIRREVEAEELADLYLSLGDIEQGLKYLASAARGNAKLTRRYALLLASLSRDRDAVILLDRLLARRPQDSELLRARAHIAMRAREYSKAIVYLESAGESLDTTLDKAVLRSYRGEIAQSEKLFQDVLREKGDEETLLLYADHLTRWGDYYRAEKIYKTLLEKRPDKANLIRLARIFVASERFEEARGIFRELLLNGEEKARLEIAESYLLDKNFQKSVSLSEGLLREGQFKEEAYLLLARAMLAARRFEEVLALLKGRGDEASLEMITAAQLALGQDVKTTIATIPDSTVKDAYRTVAEKREESQGEVLMAAAEISVGRGERERALSYLQKANKLEPGNLYVELALAQVLASLGEYESAIDIYRRLAKILPENRKVLVGLARTLSWSKRYDDAQELYERIRRLAPEDWTIQLERARVALWNKDIEGGRRFYNELIERPLAEGEELPFEAYEREWERHRNEPQKLQELVRLYPRYREQKRAFLELQSKEHLWSKHFVSATRAEERLLDIDPTVQEVLFDEGQAYCSLGLGNCARSAYRDLLEISPLHSIAQEALRREKRKSKAQVGGVLRYWDEKGRGGLSDISRLESAVSLEVPVDGRHLLYTRLGTMTERPGFTDDSIYSGFYTLGADIRINRSFTVGGSYSRKEYEGGEYQGTNTGQLYLQGNLEDYALLTLGYERHNEIYNYFSIRDRVQSDEVYLKGSSYLTRALQLDGEVRHHNLNDNNEINRQGVALGYAFTDHPRIFKVTVAGQRRDAKEESIYIQEGERLTDIIHPYWAPRNALIRSLTFEWYHDISRQFYCGHELHYYDLKLSFYKDNKENEGVELAGEWLYQFQDHWTAKVEAGINRSQLWDGTFGTLSLNYRF